MHEEEMTAWCTANGCRWEVNPQRRGQVDVIFVDFITSMQLVALSQLLMRWPMTCRLAVRTEAAPRPPTGVDLIAAERARQITKEGYDAEHDGQHDYGELAQAAAAYAAYPARLMCLDTGAGDPGPPQDIFPWPEADKRAKHDQVRRLTIAGALIAAELDRLKPQHPPAACTPPQS